jgi:hypothetical protein
MIICFKLHLILPNAILPALLVASINAAQESNSAKRIELNRRAGRYA